MPDQESDLEARMEAAFEEAVARKEGARSPAGGYTKPGLWEPAPEERQSCCDEVTPPHPGWGWSLKKHCESTRHVARLYGVPEGALLRRVKSYMHQRNKARKEAVAAPAILFAADSQPRPAPATVLQQVERLLGKHEREFTELRRLFKGGAYGEMRTPDMGELDYWMRQLK